MLNRKELEKQLNQSSTLDIQITVSDGKTDSEIFIQLDSTLIKGMLTACTKLGVEPTVDKVIGWFIPQLREQLISLFTKE